VAAWLAALALPVIAEARESLFPPAGCSATSRINPCPTRTLPAPVGDPTDGPLTDALRDGPLDPPKDPLGFDPIEPAPRGPLLTPAKDRLGVGSGQ
jgi:hypothetical protein